MPINALLYVVDLIRNRFLMKKIRATGTDLGFPLDRNMAVLVTDRRLLTFQVPVQRFGKPRPLAAVPLTEVAGARFPYVGGGWRVVELHLSSGLRVRFLADRPHAEGLVSALSRGVTGSSNGAE